MDFAGGDECGFRELSALYLDQTAAPPCSVAGCDCVGRHQGCAAPGSHARAGASGTCGVGGMAKMLSEMEKLAMEGRTAGLKSLLNDIMTEFDKVRIFLEKRRVNA